MEKTLEQHPSNLIKIVLFGPESTGKTTLSRELAKHYKTNWVPEFARDYLQDKWKTQKLICELKDIVPIAIGQIQLENKLALTANKVLICDTDLLETKVYSQQYYNGVIPTELEKAISKNTYDFYFLTYIDTPWEADDLRDKPEEREEMFNAFEQALITHNKPYLLLKGDKETRLQTAIHTIDKLLTTKSLK